jgi:hypothetical protein
MSQKCHENLTIWFDVMGSISKEAPAIVGLLTRMQSIFPIFFA